MVAVEVRELSSASPHGDRINRGAVNNGNGTASDATVEILFLFPSVGRFVPSVAVLRYSSNHLRDPSKH